MQDKLWLSTISVGRELVLMPFGNFARTAGGRTPITRAVSKVGRKYFYIGNDAFSLKPASILTARNAMADMYSIRIWQPMRKQSAPQTNSLLSSKLSMQICMDMTDSAANEPTRSRMWLSMRYTAFWLIAGPLTPPIRRREKPDGKSAEQSASRGDTIPWRVHHRTGWSALCHYAKAR